MYDLWIGSVVAALAVGFFVWGLIFWCVIRYRKRSEELPPQTRYNMPIEILYSVPPFLVIAVLFFYTAIVQTDVDKLSPNPDVTVEVVASKWNWQFRYTGTQGPDGQRSATIGATDYVPVLVLPTHKTIRFTETRRTSSTRSGCRTSCSSGTCSRACRTSSRSPSRRRVPTSAAAPSCAAPTTR